MLRSAGASALVTRPVLARLNIALLQGMFAEILEQLCTAGRLDRARVRRWWSSLTDQEGSGELFALLPARGGGDGALGRS